EKIPTERNTGHGILRIKLKDSKENKIEKPTADLRLALWAHSSQEEIRMFGEKTA
ncbi:2536_t:CDS:1, partial [Gigaspora rosea]